VSSTDATVLILGETGTGKELIARAIHDGSRRKARPLIRVNCATLPANLIESELFGHEKGAFTGAISQKTGRFELANKTTLFLDEIGELPIELQPKLLRVLQDGEFERLGGGQTKTTDVRIIAATNRDLEKAVEEGRFRRDLWYRLNVYPISIPPLRERSEDIPLLVEWFLEKYNKKMGKRITIIPRETRSAMKRYSWPGNIRELENLVERSVITSRGNTLTVDMPECSDAAMTQGKTLGSVERDHILHVLKGCGWKIEGPDGAASILGLAPSTLRSRMQKHDIRRPGLK
jgi:chemotaxis protein methyltransferase CheR